MNILITGSEGFIGKKLTSKLVLKHDVFTFDQIESNEHLSKKHFVGDVLEINSIAEIEDPVEVIFHFGSASSVRSFAGKEEELSNKEIQSFISALEFARSKKVRRFIYPSTASIYTFDSQRGRNIVNPSNIYAATKFTEEHLASLYSKYFDTVGLRIFMVYGPGEEGKGERASPITLFIEDILKGKSPVIYGDGTQTRDALFVDDLVDVLNNMLQVEEKAGVYDVCTGHAISFNEILSIISKIKGDIISPTYIPRPKSYVEGTPGNPEFTLKLLGRKLTSIEKGIEKLYDYLSNR
jgi:UDP-glucose 4-epimerase